MLSRLLFVRLKSAENALRDGRLDEAYRLATAPDIREHRRGAAVLAALTERFLERARDHFRSDRFTEALMDLDRAAASGVGQGEVAELRKNVQTVMAEHQRRDQSRRDRIDQARRRIEGGSLVAGRKLLAQAGEDDHDADQLRRAAEQRADDAADIVDQVRRLMEQGQLATAAKRICRAKALDPHNEAVSRVAAQLCNLVLDNAGVALRDGKLSRASDELACLGELGDKLPIKRELADVIAIARDAARCIGTGRFADARRHAMSLNRLLPDAQWVRAIVDQLGQVGEIQTALAAGPLGDRVIVSETDRAKRPRRRIEGGAGADRVVLSHEPKLASSLDDTVALPAIGGADTELPDRLLLLVDGGGSYLILRSPQASVGRAASNCPADVAIFADVAERHANITRVDDDYFLFSAKNVEVGGRKTKHQLLRDGDRIVLGRKAKLTFRLPTRKSPSAALDLSDTTKMPNDVRRVILFHQHATVGAGAGAHIRCRHAGTPLVLFERSGALYLRRKNDGHVDTEPVRLRFGEPIEIGDVSLVLEPWHVRTVGQPIV